MNAQNLSRPCVTRASYWLSTVGVALPLLAALLLAGGPAGAQSIQRITAPGKFYVDDKLNAGVPAGIVYNYAVYSVSNNTGVNIPSAYVALTNIFPTNRIQLAPIDSGVRQLGALAAGQTKLAAFFLKGPGFTGNSDTLLDLTNELHDVQVWSGPPGAGSLMTAATYSYTNIIYVIEAAANKVTVITNLNPLAILGSEVALVIAGDTGTIGGNNSISFSPGVLGSWRPDAYQLLNTVVRFSQNPTYTNQLYFDPTIAGFTDYSGQQYTNTFLFRAVKVTGTNLPISPFAFVDSGSGTKHTTLSSLIEGGGSNIIYSASNIISIVNHTVAPGSLLAPGGTVTYSVTFSNHYFVPLSMDEIVNVLPGIPANLTYLPGSATYNSLAITNPIITGQTLRWAQPFDLPANGTGTLTFQAVAPLTAGSYTNRVTGVIGSEQIDLTLDTTDNAPATSVLTIVPVSDLGLAKSGPATTPAAGNFNYTLTVTNLGPSPASSVTVTDALPASVTFVSASGGGFLSGGNVIWTNLSVAAGTSTGLTLTVTAPPQLTALTNTASVSGPDLDPNSTNNVNPPVVTSVTPVADLQLSKTAPPVVANGNNFDYTLTVTNLGPSTATNVAVTDVLPANVLFVSASHGGFFSGGNVLWTNLGALAPDSSLALTLTVTAPASGAMTNTASVISPVSDPNGSNNVTPPVISSVGNVPPTTVDDAAGTPRNQPVSVNVLANDSDANGNPLTLISVTQTNGTAVLNGANVDYAPATNFLGNVVLTYTVIDGQGGTNTGLLTISVTNRPPVAVNDAALVTNGVPRVLFPLVNDSDPDGDSLLITNALASNGTVTINPGATNLTFTPTNALGGTITYTVADGFGGTATATIVLASFNAAPTAFNQGIVLPEDTSTNLVYTATDDGTNLTFAILTAPTNGLITAFDANAGTATYAPNTNYFGPDNFTFTVFDGALYATGLVNLTIIAQNDAPVATNLNVSTAEDTATNLVLVASDVDSTNLVFAILAGPTNGNLGTLNTNTGAVTYTPATNYFGADSFTFTVFDGALYATGSVSLTITPANDAPIANSQSVTNLEDTAFPITLTSADGDGPVTNFTLVALPLHGTLSGSGANLTYAPATNYNGPDSFTFTVNDGSLTSAVATVSIVLLPVNDQPALTNDVVVMNEDGTNSIPVLANDRDPDGTPLVLVSVTSSNGTATVVGTNVVFVPAPNYTGTNTLTYFATDGTVTNSATITIVVLPVNDAPTVNNLIVTIPEDSTLSTNIVGSDVDGNPLTYGIIFKSPASLLVLNSGTGEFSYTPPLNDTTTNLVLLSVFDGSLYATSTVQIIIMPVNDAPVATNLNVTIPEDTATNLVLTASDVDSTNLVFAILSGPANGNLTGFNNASGAVTYTPATNYFGNDSLVFTVFDGALYATGSVSITITTANDAPIANSQSVTNLENSPVVITLTSADVDGPVTNFVVAALPLHGSLSGSGASLTYTPTNNYDGPDSFTFTVNDGSLTSAVATVFITVLPVADVAATVSGPTNVTPGQVFSYLLTITNLGASTASNVVVVDTLPASLVFSNATGGGVLSNAVVTWTLPVLPPNTGTNFTLWVIAPTNGVFTNFVASTASTFDPNPANNNGSAQTARVTSAVVPVTFGVLAGNNVFNPQTGLYEQTVVVTNTSGSTLAALRLLVGDFASTNGAPRTNVWLWNASGTNFDGRRFVQYNSPLDPGEFVAMRLEFYNPTRVPFTNSLAVEVTLPTPATTNLAGGVAIDTVFVDNRESGNPRLVIEWTSTVGANYTVIYSDDNMLTWRAATPTVTASATRTQWYDDGPPKTVSKPQSVNSRFYRVILNP